MNADEYPLFQSKSQLALKPEAELNFADLLMNQVVEAAFCVGANGQFLYVNDATSRLTEYSREELLSMSLHDVDIDFSLHDWSQKWRQVCLLFKSRYRTKGGRIFVVEITITYVQHEGREFGCAFVRSQSDEVVNLHEFPDNSEFLPQKMIPVKRREAKQLIKTEMDFVSLLCHQFRTPLNVVSFSNSLIKRHINEWSGEKIRTLLERIQISVQQMSHLLDDILLFTKAEAAKLQFEPKLLDLVSFCQELVAKIQISHSQQPINFVTQGKCASVWMDEKLLEHILNNLLDNAIKYSPNCSRVDIKLACSEHQIIFQIQDTGLGIPVVDQQRLFEPFYRGSNIHHIPGTGLGLSIVKTLVDLQGGQITVESKVDVGTTVTVILPVQSSTLTS